MAFSGRSGGGLQRGDFDAWPEQSEVGEEGTNPRLTHWFERRRKGLPGSAAHSDALTDVSDPPLAGQHQPNGKPAQRERD